MPTKKKSPAKRATSTSKKTSKKKIAGKSAPKSSTKKKTVAKKAAKKQPSKKPASKTEIVVQANVGWGNQLFVRGQGAPGLSWDSGTPMENQGESSWSWTCNQGKEPVEVKVLINDERWCEGENFKPQKGKKNVLQPIFS